VAQPQIRPRNGNRAAKGGWLHLAKAGFDEYFLHKVRRGEGEPTYERFLLKQRDIEKLKEPT
jgi:sulfide:quinone oxidoreductase